MDVWQEVECPQHDYDLFDSDMVYLGQKFHCLACGGEHVATHVMVTTYRDDGAKITTVALPESRAELDSFRS